MNNRGYRPIQNQPRRPKLPLFDSLYPTSPGSGAGRYLERLPAIRRAAARGGHRCRSGRRPFTALHKYHWHSYGPLEDDEREEDGLTAVFFDRTAAEAEAHRRSQADQQTNGDWGHLFAHAEGSPDNLTSLPESKLRRRMKALGISPPEDFADWAYWWSQEWVHYTGEQRMGVWECSTEPATTKSMRSASSAWGRAGGRPRGDARTS